MNWLTILEITGMVITVGLLFLLMKELKKNIKDSNDGKVSGKCDLD